MVPCDSVRTDFVRMRLKSGIRDPVDNLIKLCLLRERCRKLSLLHFLTQSNQQANEHSNPAAPPPIAESRQRHAQPTQHQRVIPKYPSLHRQYRAAQDGN